jgi:hypothetical protein
MPPAPPTAIGLADPTHTVYWNMAEGRLHSDTERYFRFNCDKDFDTFDGHHGLSDIALDGHGHLQNVRNVTESYLQREAGQIDQCVRQLQVQARSIAFVP